MDCDCDNRNVGTNLTWLREKRRKEFEGTHSGGGLLYGALAATIPPNVIADIKAAPSQGGIFNIDLNTTYTGNILKADSFQIASGAKLILAAITNPNYSFVALIARNWLFSAPEIQCIIQRDLTLFAPDGANGTIGANGSNGGYDNQPGGPGGNGNTGGAGGQIKLLPVYLLGEQITTQAGAPVSYLNATIVFPGVNGGNGGEGGQGGTGGNGHNGNPGSDSLVDCKRGPGNGGAGGQGGPGGQGGSGGNGSDGATLIYGGTQSFLTTIAFANVVNSGGSSGQGGRGGRGGYGGTGGDRGSQTFYCHGGSNGAPGGHGLPGPNGPVGPNGAKGFTDVSQVANLDAFY
jgi:hypothetical protein